jgi:glycosyltransferase involved in cell wall biosynthesis
VAYNAEKTIVKLLDRFSDDLWNKADEVLIADDESHDLTETIALRYKEEYNRAKLKVIKHKKNKGYGGNQKWGYSYAIKNGYDIVIMVHGDAQYPPEYIIPLIKPIEDGQADFMFGSRMAGDPLGGGMPLYKFFANKFLTTTENLILGTRLSEFHSGFRAYNVHALKEIPFMHNTDGYHFDSEIIVQLVIARKNIGEITIPTYYGEEKCNVPGIKYGLSLLRLMSQYILHRNQIRYYPIFDLSKSVSGIDL